MKTIYNRLLFILLCTLYFSNAHAQLEKVIVEKYYVSDSLDATDTTGGGLAIGSVTYRIYIDMLPGSKLQKIYGDVNHAIKISSTANFFNNISDGQSFAKDFPKNRLQENTVALDSWLTLGQTTRNSTLTYFGILKSGDNNGSFIGGNNNDGGSAAISSGLLINADPSAGIPLTTADGMDTMLVLPGNWADVGIVVAGIDSTIFGSVISGSQFISYAMSLQNSGVSGVIPDSNQVLIAQLTTTGTLSFELNIELTDSAGTIIKYVGNDSILLADETFNRYLKYPYEQICGCPDAHYLEYIADRDCDAIDSCKNLIVFGCMDPNACNYNSEANFNIPELCCYPGLCNDRDISVVCPNITVGNRSFNIYPNPATHQLTLNITSELDALCSYTIYNSFGKVVSESQFISETTANSSAIDVSTLETGIYHFCMIINDTVLNKSFVKN